MGFGMVDDVANSWLLCRVTSTYLWPFKEDVTRFDFEVDEEDENRVAEWLMKGVHVKW